MDSGRSQGHPHTSLAPWNPKTGSVAYFTFNNFPLNAALRSALVCLMLMRFPIPYGPPTHPVLTSQQLALYFSIFRFAVSSASELRMVNHERRTETGAECEFRLFPKPHFRSGDLCRVPGNKLVQRLMGGELQDGGQTPEPSHVRRIMFFG